MFKSKTSVSFERVLYLLNCNWQPNTLLIKRLFELYYEKSRHQRVSDGITREEYDCLCDLLLIPRHIRYGTEAQVDSYIQQINANKSAYNRFSVHSTEVLLYLCAIKAGVNFYLSGGFAAEMLAQVVYYRTVGNMSYVDAVYNMFKDMVNKGVTDVSIKFLYEFFNDKVRLQIVEGRSCTPNQALQCSRTGKPLRNSGIYVDKKGRYRISAEAQSALLPIYGCFVDTLYDSWVN